VSAPATAAPPAGLLVLDGVRKSYNVGLPSEAEVLHGLSFSIGRGEFVALIGPTGSGKSTLLNIVGLLEHMTAGSYRIDGDEVMGLDDAALTLRRRTTLGFVFQFHHLLPAFTALENVTLPALMREGRVTPAQPNVRAPCLPPSVWAMRWASARANCPAACSSAWRSHARWCSNPRWCWPTNPPAISTPPRPTRSSP